MSKLQNATLHYGSSFVRVHVADHLPIPIEFDFTNPEACARLIFACMSNASGGFLLKDCKLQYSVKHRTANLTANGAHVYYSTGEKIVFNNDPDKIINYLEDLQKNTVVIELGDVRTDQYGNGYKRAKWS